MTHIASCTNSRHCTVTNWLRQQWGNVIGSVLNVPDIKFVQSPSMFMEGGPFLCQTLTMSSFLDGLIWNKSNIFFFCWHSIWCVRPLHVVQIMFVYIFQHLQGNRIVGVGTTRPMIHFENDFASHTGLQLLNPFIRWFAVLKAVLNPSQSQPCISWEVGFGPWLVEERQ